MIKKHMVNNWMVSDPFDPDEFKIDFEEKENLTYYYDDEYSEIDKHYYTSHVAVDCETDEIIDISRIGIGFLDLAIKNEFKDFPEELNVYLIDEEMKVKDYLIKRFCLNKEPIPKAIRINDKQFLELMHKKGL
ncbi:hypothetical protein WKS98_02220 [Lagierella sp. ICN-221743]